MARELPIPSRNSHTHRPKASAQRKAETPAATLGDRKCIERGSYTGTRTKNSPSRWRFRPPSPLTFGFRLVPSKSASTYSRSVLGAVVNLLSGGGRHKRVIRGKSCKVRTNVLHTFHTLPAGLWRLR